VTEIVAGGLRGSGNGQGLCLDGGQQTDRHHVKPKAKPCSNQSNQCSESLTGGDHDKFYAIFFMLG